MTTRSATDWVLNDGSNSANYDTRYDALMARVEPTLRLLPAGYYLRPAPGSNLFALLSVIADEYNDVHELISQALREIDPTTALWYLAEWETELDLPVTLNENSRGHNFAGYEDQIQHRKNIIAGIHPDTLTTSTALDAAGILQHNRGLAQRRKYLELWYNVTRYTTNQPAWNRETLLQNVLTAYGYTDLLLEFYQPHTVDVPVGLSLRSLVSTHGVRVFAPSGHSYNAADESAVFQILSRLFPANRQIYVSFTGDVAYDTTELWTTYLTAQTLNSNVVGFQAKATLPANVVGLRVVISGIATDDSTIAVDQFIIAGQSFLLSNLAGQSVSADETDDLEFDITPFIYGSDGRKYSDYAQSESDTVVEGAIVSSTS